VTLLTRLAFGRAPTVPDEPETRPFTPLPPWPITVPGFVGRTWPVAAPGAQSGS
jgi:hypothetical protein